MKRKTLSKTLLDAAKNLRFEKATVDKLESLNILDVRDKNAKQIKQIITQRAKTGRDPGRR